MSESPQTVAQLTQEAKRISDDISNNTQQIAQLGSSIATLQNDFTQNLHAPADLAVQSIILLSQQVEKLSQAPDTETSALVAECKGISVVAGKRFGDLQSAAGRILKSATDLAVEVTYQESKNQSKIERVGVMRKLLAVMLTNDDTMQQTYSEQIADLTKSIATAKQTLQDAQEKERSDMEAKDVFDGILWPHNPIDAAGLTAAVKDGERTVSSAVADVTSTQDLLNQANANASTVAQEVAAVGQLDGQLQSFVPTLTQQNASLTTLLGQVHTLENSSLDASVVLSGLSGKATILFAQHSAKQLATSVLEIENLMGTESKLTGVIIDNPDSMDAALSAIASSTVAPTPMDGLM